MSHENYQQLVSQFIDSELQRADEQELFEHLGTCTECRDFLKASWKLQADVYATKPQIVFRGSYLADRHPVHQSAPQSRSRSAISTLVLLVMVTLIVGILFSANVAVQRTPDFPTQEISLPK